MSVVRERLAEWLLEQRASLLAEVEEVNLMLSLIDAPVEQNGTRPKKRNGTPPGINAKELGKRTRAAVIAVLGRNGGCTTAFVSEEVGVTRSTAEKHLRALVKNGRAERKLGAKGDGRAPWVYKLISAVEEREHHLDEKTNVVLD